MGTNVITYKRYLVLAHKVKASPGMFFFYYLVSYAIKFI